MMWLPYFLSQHVGVGPAAAGVLATVFDLAGALGSVVIGVVVDRCYNGKMISICLPLSLVTGAAFCGWVTLFLSEARTQAVPSMTGHIIAISLIGLLVACPD